eukprot:Skav202525  [mRNA]  locus=scaffold2011:54185:55199:- [translate_table: standard]
MSSPEAWQDFRSNKPSPRFPDFKRVADGEALWIDSSGSPEWVKAKMIDFEGDFASPRQGRSKFQGDSSSSKEDLWQEVMSSPAAWQDFRSNKPSPRFPDFKRVADGKALWIDSSGSPEWVKKKMIDFEGDFASGAQVGSNSFGSNEALWSEMFASLEDWEDFRGRKPSSKFPDFKRREDGKGLWLEGKLGSAPESQLQEWVHKKLEEVGDFEAPEVSHEYSKADEIPPKLTDPAEINARWEKLLAHDVEHPGREMDGRAPYISSDLNFTLRRTWRHAPYYA